MVYFIATPIGNMADLGQRAVEILSSVDCICCEDTRHSGVLLKKYDISRPLVSLHEHNERVRAEEIARRALAGESFAVISDAGMPGVSDPGYRLLNALQACGAEYTVVPGPSAVLTALIGSGLPSDSFYFGGFLPPKSGRRKNMLQHALEQSHTSIFFESPHRLDKSLSCLLDLDGDAQICVCRELTKSFEEYRRGSVRDVQAHYQNKPAKGEIVLVIGGVNTPRSPQPAE